MIYCEANTYQNSSDPSTHRVFRGRTHVHLCADTDQELIAYATSIGLKASWFQKSPTCNHFDVTGRFMERVMKDTRVTKLSRFDLVNKWRAKRGQPPLPWNPWREATPSEPEQTVLFEEK